MTAAKSLHLIVGHSMFLRTANRLRRVYVGDPKILQSFTSSPNEVVVTAKAPGISSIALWDGTGHSTLYSISADIDFGALQQALAEALPGSDIQVKADAGQIYLSGTVPNDAAHKQADALAAIYSKDVVDSIQLAYVHPKQVELKVRIAEVDRTKAAQFGFNFLSAGSKLGSTSTQQFTSVGVVQGANGSAQVGISNLLNLFFYDSQLNVGATIADLESKDVLQILAEPTISTVSGQEASFLAGGEFPFPVVQGGGASFASVTILFKPFGVKLVFTPTVNADGTILLKVAPEVSALDFSNAVTISGFTVPAISTRHAETTVELRDGQTMGISGLLDHRTTVLLSEVPGISSIPILGQLFKSRNITHSVVELVVIVTARVIDPIHQDMHPTTPGMSLPNMTKQPFDKSVRSNWFINKP